MSQPRLIEHMHMHGIALLRNCSYVVRLVTSDFVTLIFCLANHRLPIA